MKFYYFPRHSWFIFFFFVNGLVDEMTIRLDELEELVKKGPPGNERKGPRIGVEEEGVVAPLPPGRRGGGLVMNS